MSKISASENSERKRVSIPRADESVLAWWEAQKDPGLSIRILIRDEIRRSGYTDAAYRPVAQLPQHDRLTGVGVDARGGGGAGREADAEAGSTASSSLASQVAGRADEARRETGETSSAAPSLSTARVARHAAEMGQHAAEADFSASPPATRAARRAAEAGQHHAGDTGVVAVSSTTIDDLMNG